MEPPRLPSSRYRTYCFGPVGDDRPWAEKPAGGAPPCDSHAALAWVIAASSRAALPSLRDCGTPTAVHANAVFPPESDARLTAKDATVGVRAPLGPQPQRALEIRGVGRVPVTS